MIKIYRYFKYVFTKWKKFFRVSKKKNIFNIFTLKNQSLRYNSSYNDASVTNETVKITQLKFFLIINYYSNKIEWLINSIGNGNNIMV